MSEIASLPWKKMQPKVSNLGKQREYRKENSICLLHKKALELEKKFLPDIYNRICAAL